MASARRLAFGGWDNTRHFYCGSTILAPRGAVPCPGDRQETARALPYVRVSVGEKKVTDFPEISRKFEGLRLELVSINFALVQQKSVPGVQGQAVTAPRPRPVPMLPYCSPEPYRTLVSYRAGNTSARINPNTRCDAIGSWCGTGSGHVLVRTCHGYLIALPTLQWPLLLLSISRKGAQSCTDS